MRYKNNVSSRCAFRCLLFSVCFSPPSPFSLQLPFAVRRATLDVHRSPFDVFGPLR